MTDVKMNRLPVGFRQYPAGAIGEGEIGIDLGGWIIDGKDESVYMRVSVRDLPKLVKILTTTDGRARRFAYDSIQVFVVANNRKRGKKGCT